MLALHFAPVVLAGLLLGAHFYRAGLVLGVVASLALVGVAFLRRPWARRVAQAGLLLGALEWLRTMATFAAERIATGQPYLRMVLILAGVALATALGALVLERGMMRRRCGLSDDAGFADR